MGANALEMGLMGLEARRALGGGETRTPETAAVATGLCGVCVSSTS